MYWKVKNNKIVMNKDQCYLKTFMLKSVSYCCTKSDTNFLLHKVDKVTYWNIYETLLNTFEYTWHIFKNVFWFDTTKQSAGNQQTTSQCAAIKMKKVLYAFCQKYNFHWIFLVVK